MTMKTIDLHGITWEVHSPSFYVHHHPEAVVTLWYDGKEWTLGINGSYRDTKWSSRDDVARAFADAVNLAIDARQA
jgi:hypothetical protein